MARNDVRVKRAFHHLEAFWQVELPERFAKFQERISAPDVIDQDVKLTVLLLDPGDEPLDGPAAGMVNDGGGAYPPPRRHPLRRFFHRLSPPWSARRSSPSPQGNGDSSAGPPGRTGHKSDFFAQIGWSVGRGHGCLHTRLPNFKLNCPCASTSGREFTLKRGWYADEEIQPGAERSHQLIGNNTRS